MWVVTCIPLEPLYAIQGSGFRVQDSHIGTDARLLHPGANVHNPTCKQGAPACASVTQDPGKVFGSLNRTSGAVRWWRHCCRCSVLAALQPTLNPKPNSLILKPKPIVGNFPHILEQSCQIPSSVETSQKLECRVDRVAVGLAHPPPSLSL